LNKSTSICVNSSLFVVSSIFLKASAKTANSTLIFYNIQNKSLNLDVCLNPRIKEATECDKGHTKELSV